MNKKLFFLIFISVSFIGINSSYCQNQETECKVLLESISTSYQGKCKKGLAHGIGIAKGMDTYEGKFKNGYPHGQGVYTWRNGDVYEGNWSEGKRDGKGKMMYKSISNDSIIYAYWKDDVLSKEIELPAYHINYKSSNISRVIFEQESSKRNDVEIFIMRSGRVIRSFNYIDFTGTSGSFNQSANYIGFENVMFPFEGSLRFKSSNQLNTAVYDYILRFKITKKGSWNIKINI